MPQLGESIPGAMDQIVYAPAELYEYEPLGSAAIDDNVTEFLDQFRAWVDDPSYFQDNAIWVEDPGHWDYEVECDWYYWGDFPEIECTTVPVWVDGDEYWSYAHMNQSAVQLAEALGWENPVFPSAISLEGGNIIEQVFGQIFGVGVFGGVLSGGGIGGWEIEIGLDGDDRGIAFSILIYDIAEETEPRDWRPYSIGEAVFLSANGFDIPRIHRVKIFRKEYGPAKFAGFQNQVIAPNGNIYIPDGNWSFRANLPWSEDYMLEDDWALMTFLHESFHVYQKRAKYRAPGVFWIKAINRDYGYDIEEGKDFWDYSLEQQATIIMERWYLGVTGQRTGYDNTVTMDELNAVIPFTCIVCQ